MSVLRRLRDIACASPFFIYRNALNSFRIPPPPKKITILRRARNPTVLCNLVTQVLEALVV